VLYIFEGTFESLPACVLLIYLFMYLFINPSLVPSFLSQFHFNVFIGLYSSNLSDIRFHGWQIYRNTWKTKHSAPSTILVVAVPL